MDFYDDSVFDLTSEDDLLEVPGIAAVQTRREGGFSTGPYSSLNLALHVGDDPQSVAKNREKVSKLFGGAPIVYMEQVHSDKIKLIDQIPNQPPVCDALITRQRGIGLAVMTADCLPLLIAARNCELIAAVHCGWRGLQQEVVIKVIKKLQALGGRDFVGILGACIMPDSYEVDDAVKSKFSPMYHEAFYPRLPGKYSLDLQHLCEIQLSICRVGYVSSLCLDTYSEPDNFFSYRREKITGRQACVIMIEP